MRFRSIAVVTLLSFSAMGSARAQATVDPGCPPGTVNGLGVPDRERATQDACQQAVDLFKYMMPQLGIGLTGGNTTLAQGGALGGLGHFVIGIRGNVLAGTVPVPQQPATNGAQQRPDYETKDQILGLPAVDLALGVFKGLPLALSNVGGIDLLLSATYIPELSTDNVSITPDNPLKIGYGARVGLLQESLVIPGIGVSFMKRDLPKTTIVGFQSNDSLEVRDLDFKTTAWRVTASKSLILFTLAAGVGQDTYDVSTTISAVVNELPPVGRQAMTPVVIKEKMTRTNYFADLSMNLLLLKLVGTVGMVSGGELPTYNTFSTAADASRMYGSVGVRIGF
jgi:hypothetical protein